FAGAPDPHALTARSLEIRRLLAALDPLDPLVGGGCTRVRQDGGKSFSVVEADVTLPVSPFVHRNPKRSQRLAEGGKVDRLVIDEHAVVIENAHSKRHETRAGGHAIARVARCPSGNAFCGRLANTPAPSPAARPSSARQIARNGPTHRL